MITPITYLTRADHDPGSSWPDFYREEKIAESAGLRHESRIAATKAAALKYCAMKPEDVHATGLTGQRIAEILITLDLGGVGGDRGYSGGATRRMPWSSPLGSSRWHSGDGGAWRAAAEEAIAGAATLTPEEAEIFDYDILTSDLSTEWTTAYAARRVLSACTPEEAHAWEAIRAKAAHAHDLVIEDHKAEAIVAEVEGGIARGHSPLEARQGVDLTPLAVSYLIDKVGPSFLLTGDSCDSYTSAEDLAALPEEARAILCPYGLPPQIRIPAAGEGPRVEIINRRSALPV